MLVNFPDLFVYKNFDIGTIYAKTLDRMGGGGGNPKRTLKLWYFYEILNVKHNM